MTLKLKGDLDILKMYLYTKNEVAATKVKMSKNPNYFKHYRNIYTDQAPAISSHSF